MRSLILNAPGELTLASVPTPVPGPGEVLVRVRAATTCGTDLKAFRRGHPQIPMPGPFGHEYAGTVAAAGAGTKFEIGDDVMGVHSAPCLSCRWCLAGQENLCETIMATKVLGTYAEYVLIPERIAKVHLFPKPESLDFALASLLEPLACVMQGVLELERFGPLEGKRALVVGPGAIGWMFVAALRRRGAEVVIAARTLASERLALASNFGAEPAAFDDGGLLGGFDLVVEAAGTAQSWEKSVDFVRRGGVAMLFGGLPGGTRVSFEAGRLHYDQIALISPFHFGRSAVQVAYQALTESHFDLSPLLSEERALEDYQSVFRDLDQGRGLKYVFRP